MSITINSITRDNIDELLDRGLIEVQMKKRPGDKKERWWTIRRNGATWRGKRDPTAIRVPIKGGLNVYGKITEADFRADGTINPEFYRIKGG